MSKQPTKQKTKQKAKEEATVDDAPLPLDEEKKERFKARIDEVVGETILIVEDGYAQCFTAYSLVDDARTAYRRIVTKIRKNIGPGEELYEEASAIYSEGIAEGFRGFEMGFALSEAQKEAVAENVYEYYEGYIGEKREMPLVDIVLPKSGVVFAPGGTIILRG